MQMKYLPNKIIKFSLLILFISLIDINFHNFNDNIYILHNILP